MMKRRRSGRRPDGRVQNKRYEEEEAKYTDYAEGSKKEAETIVEYSLENGDMITLCTIFLSSKNKPIILLFITET